MYVQYSFFLFKRNSFVQKLKLQLLLFQPSSLGFTRDFLMWKNLWLSEAKKIISKTHQWPLMSLTSFKWKQDCKPSQQGRCVAAKVIRQKVLSTFLVTSVVDCPYIIYLNNVLKMSMQDRFCTFVKLPICFQGEKKNHRWQLQLIWLKRFLI